MKGEYSPELFARAMSLLSLRSSSRLCPTCAQPVFTVYEHDSRPGRSLIDTATHRQTDLTTPLLTNVIYVILLYEQAPHLGGYDRYIQLRDHRRRGTLAPQRGER